MNLTDLWLKVTVVLVAVFGCARMDSLPADRVTSAEPGKATFCVAPEYRQFDFWIGDWDAFDVDAPQTKVARTRVDRILDGCVLREEYEGTDGLKGQSLSLYDASRRVWHQSWVTNRGQLLVIAGKMEAGEMVFSGVDRTESGEERRVRDTWKSVRGGVRETALTSMDGGKTWKPWFDLLFRPHKP